MKKFLFIAIVLILWYASSQAQTVIPPTTTVDTFGNLKAGLYRFISKSDTIEIALDYQVHDTIPRICPKCPPPVICPKVDTASIQALKICPTIPPTKQRTVSGFPAWDPINKKWIFPYDDGSISTL